jgi:hypothetical protein
MSAREEVYASIDTERDYQESLRGSLITLEFNTIGDHTTVLRTYLRRADDAWTDNAGVDAALEVVRKVAGIGVRALELMGVVPRYPIPTSREDTTVGTVTSRAKVYEILDQERAYQDNKWKDIDDRNSVGDFLSYMSVLGREATKQSDVDNPERALNVIRKLTATAIACMERHGAIPRISSKRVIMPLDDDLVPVQVNE